MDLIELTPRTRGRPKREVDYEIVGELNDAELALLESNRHIQPIDPVELRDSHHTLAKALARGARPAEASIITGYSSSRISILQRSPAFQQLVADYKEITDNGLVDYRTRLRDMGMDVLSNLWADATENPDKYSPGFLLDLGKVFVDRGGLAPETRSVNTNVNVDMAVRLEKGLARAEKAKTIDTEGNEI